MRAPNEQRVTVLQEQALRKLYEAMRVLHDEDAGPIELKEAEISRRNALAILDALTKEYDNA